MSDPSPESAMPIEIDVQAVKQLQNEAADFVLLDVREKDENEFASIEGSQLFPMSELNERIADLEFYRDKHIVVHCHHGGRSLNVTQVLRQQGFAKVQNMTGGIQAWSEQINPDVPTY